MTLRVSWLGTCRVMEPVKALATLSARCEPSTAWPYGFLHSTAEILQCLDYSDGGAFPEELIP